MICKHLDKTFASDNVGTCRLCGEVTKYDFEGKNDPVILTPGVDFDLVIPTDFPIELKQSIALVVKERGLGFVRDSTGLHGRILIAWKAVYCRDWSKYQATIAAKKSARGEKDTKLALPRKLRATGPLQEPVARPGGAQVLFEKMKDQLLTIVIVSTTSLHPCCLCGYDIQDNPHYVESPAGTKLWMDGKCARGLEQFLGAFSIDFETKKED